MDPQTPTEPPPPAYESEHDYDRKISAALERSLAISNQAQQPASIPPGEEDEWEEWNEARFEAAATLAREREQRQDAEQSSPPILRPTSEKEPMTTQDAWYPNHRSGEASSSTSVPAQSSSLRRLPACPPAKERPSWYSEAQLDASKASASSQNSQVSSPPPIHHLPPEEDDPDEPLPPFAPVGPSLEGPPFEEVVGQPPRLRPASNIDSPPQSPLDSVESDSPPYPQSFPEYSNRRGYGGHYRSTSPRQSLAPSMLPPIPQPSPAPSSSPRPPPMRFDPSVAYTKHLNLNLPPSEAGPVDASAFYNSAVSSHFGSTQTPKKTLPLRRDTASSSYSNRPEVAVTSPTLHGALSPSSTFSAIQSQTSLSNPQVLYPQPTPRQQGPGVPSFYGHQYLGAAPRAPSRTPTPTPPPWPPLSNNHGSGYMR